MLPGQACRSALASQEFPACSMCNVVYNASQQNFVLIVLVSC